MKKLLAVLLVLAFCAQISTIAFGQQQRMAIIESMGQKIERLTTSLGKGRIRVPTINTESTVYLSAPFTTIALATLSEFPVEDLEGVKQFIRAEQPIIGVFFADTPIKSERFYLPRGIYGIRMVSLSSAMFINVEGEEIASVPVSIRSVPTYAERPEVAISMETHSPAKVTVEINLVVVKVKIEWET